MDPNSQRTEAPSRRETALGVVGVTVGLLLILGLAASLLRVSAKRLDGDALLAEWFAVEELPHGLEVASAGRLPGGEEVVRLVSSLAPPEVAESDPVPASDSADEPADASSELTEDRPVSEEPADSLAPDSGGSAVPAGAGAPSTDEPVPPLEVTILHYPLATADRELARLFDAGDDDKDRLKHDPRGRRLSWGQVDWDRYRASYALVRTERDDGFVDSVRVNLSQEGFACALVARWTRDHAGALAPVEDLLAALHPRE